MKFNLSKDEAISLKIQNEATENQTNLPFLMEHRGLRTGKLHIILSSTGAGKSTLVRTILLDFINNNEGDVLLWLSEETTEDFKTNASYLSDFHLFNNRLVIRSEVDPEVSAITNKSSNPQNLLLKTLSDTGVNNFSLIIFDNITTSSIYTDNITTQQEMAAKIKELSQRSNCPFVIVAHTSKNEKTKKLVFDSDSIKGSGKITQVSEYIYCLQTMIIKNERRSFLILEKSRNHGGTGKTYTLNYSSRQKIYEKIKEVPHEEFKILVRGKNGI